MNGVFTKIENNNLLWQPLTMVSLIEKIVKWNKPFSFVGFKKIVF